MNNSHLGCYGNRCYWIVCSVWGTHWGRRNNYQTCDNNVARPDINTPSTETEETIFATESMCCVWCAIWFWRSSGEAREYFINLSYDVHVGSFGYVSLLCHSPCTCCYTYICCSDSNYFFSAFWKCNKDAEMRNTYNRLSVGKLLSAG